MATKPKKGTEAIPARKNLGGRRELDAADRRDTLVRVLTTESEYEELKGAAAYVGLSVSTWMRVVGLERARAVAAEKEAARNRDEQ